MPDTTWPVNGRPPGSSRSRRYTPVSMSSVFISTLQQLRRTSSCPLPDASSAPFPTRSPRQSLANAAVGGLKPPPAGRLRRANLHLSRSTASRSSIYIEPLSTFVTHACVNMDGGRSFIPPWHQAWCKLRPLLTPRIAVAPNNIQTSCALPNSSHMGGELGFSDST